MSSSINEFSIVGERTFIRVDEDYSDYFAYKFYIVEHNPVNMKVLAYIHSHESDISLDTKLYKRLSTKHKELLISNLNDAIAMINTRAETDEYIIPRHFTINSVNIYLASSILSSNTAIKYSLRRK